MTFANTVQIGPEFFDKSKDDYSDWHWALIREFMQNGIDCGSGRIDVDIVCQHGITRVFVGNDGAPMSEHILVDKLLSLGASGKDFAGTVGGFGKAKEILYFCHLTYKIHTGSFLVDGQGAGYDLSEVPHLPGTESTIMINEDCALALTNNAHKFAEQCQWKGEFYVNGCRLDTNLKKGSRRRDFGWATVYTNKSFRHQMIVRIDGMPMFSRHIGLDRCVVVEVNRSSGEALQSNRDGLKWEYQRKLDSFIDELTVDKHSALRDTPVTTYHHFDGDKQKCGGAEEAMRDLMTAACVTADPEEETDTISADRRTNYDDNCVMTESETRIRRMGNQCSFEFIVKNNTNLTVPSHFLPSDFSAYSKKLASVWVKCLLELHRLFDCDDTFSVGFILDEDCEAEVENDDDRYGRVYYINPAVINEQSVSRSRSLKKRWKFNNAGYYALLADAVHEFVHRKISYHDEDYAGELTRVAGVVMANKNRFHHCFR